MKTIKSLFKQKKVKFAIIFIALLSIGYVSYTKYFAQKNSKNVQETLTANVSRGDLKEVVSASGQIVNANYLSVTTSVNGIVSKVYVKEGDLVSKGQPIMDITLNSDGEESLSAAWASYLSEKNSLESAKNSLLNLENSMVKAEEDFQTEKENNSYQDHDERVTYKYAENTYNSAKNAYDIQKDTITQKEVSLNKAWKAYQAQSPTIIAPDSGIIANIVVVEGMDITNSLSERTSSAVASIKKENPPIASLNVTEIDISKIEVGNSVELRLSSIQNKVFDGVVVGIDKVGTSSSGVANYPVIVKFGVEADQVLPNMGVDADIIIHEKKDVLYVPISAVKSFNDKKIVRLTGQEKPVEVKTGIQTREYIEITEGLNEGDVVLIDTLPTSGFTQVPASDEKSNSRSGPSMFPGVGGGAGGRR